MRKHTKETSVFFELLRAGLWEHEARLSQFGEIEYKYIFRIAEEQSVVGLIAAGLEQVSDVKIPKDLALTFAGYALQLEQRNRAMNEFLESLIQGMRSAGIYALLLKGQGIAQCYEKPLWRASGDIDLLLGKDDFKKTEAFLMPSSTVVEEADSYKLHGAMTMGSWLVETHGTLRGGLWKQLDRSLDKVQAAIFYEGKVRSWMNGKTQVFLPNADEDIVYVFSHILQHFFRGGIGLRQICDWCRLLWTYRDSIDTRLLGKRLKEMGVVTEWKAFAALAVHWLGMPSEAMPLYSSAPRWRRKGNIVIGLIIEAGNFGQNRDLNYQKQYSFLIRKAISLWRLTWDNVRQLWIFPVDPLIVWNNMIVQRIKLVIHNHLRYIVHEK